jgi:hypothetical protein
MSETVNLTGFPQYLADALGTNLFAGQILASLIVMMLFIIPLAILTKGRNWAILVIAGLGSLGFCTAMLWFPVWMMAIICLLIAVLWAEKFTSKV